ncbi:MAG: hypothetical protein OER12_03825 [Acidimicrobiia bacterium]|nr:hypothetical protein [Acidimicrobiia bacterium]
MPRFVAFPRSRVLLPAQRLNLRVYDPALTGRLAGVEEFCSVFASVPEAGAIGVRASITARSTSSDGRLDIQVLGRARLRLSEPTAESVEAEELPEPLGDGDVELLRRELERGCRRFAAAAVESGQPASISSSLHADPTIASYQAATILPISHPERQELLEIDTTTGRLEQELRIVAGETGILRHMLGLGRMGA